MKKVTTLFIIISIVYLIIGGILVIQNKLDSQIYFNSFSIIAGLASIIGLIAFVLPKLSKKDVENIGIEYFKNVVEASEELKSKEFVLSKKEKEIEKLEIQKKEMEFLVKKASMVLFLTEQYNRKIDRIREITDNHKELQKLALETRKTKEKLIKLGEEIETDPNAELLYEIIYYSSPLKKRNYSFFDIFERTLESLI